MNAFSFIDETIRGTVRFFFGYVYATVLLYCRPFVGPRRLYRRLKDLHSDQISSPTYLAISIVLATPFLLGFVGSLGESESPVSTFFMTQARAISQGDLEGMGALVGGTIAGTIFVCGVLRIVAQLGRLKGRRREQFTTIGEYHSGVLVLGLAITFSAANLIVDSVNLLQSIRGTIAFYLILGIALLALILPGCAAAVNLWTQLLRTSRGLSWIRSFRATWKAAFKVGPTEGFRQFRELQRRFYGFEPGQRPSFGQQLRSAGYLVIGYILVLLPILMAGVAVGAGAYSTNWLLRREETKPITLYGVACTIDARGVRATALAWNNLDAPAIRWRPTELSIDVLAFSGQNSMSGEASWQLEPLPREDFLAPQQSLEIGGSVVLPHELRGFVRPDSRLDCTLGFGQEIGAG